MAAASTVPMFSGGQYDGTYTPSPTCPEYFDGKVRVSVPAGVALVTGYPAQPFGYAFDVDATFKLNGSCDFEVQTPSGPVNERTIFMRTLPM
jgi:hypothetical protein